MRAIIVDDEQWMCKYFAGACADVSELELVNSFHDPVKALAYLEKNPVDIVFLDYEMPKMTGTQAAAVVRAMNPSARIVFVAAGEAHQAEVRQKNLADACLTKPYNAEDLRLAIRIAYGEAAEASL